MNTGNKARCYMGASAAVLALVQFMAPSVASAQSNTPAAEVESIVVTGTSIRGVAPVGSNLIQVGEKQIQQTGGQTLTQILQTIPALSSNGAAGQGQNASSFYQPQIHQLGSSASTTTLILIDGHRTSSGGTNHTNTDPGLIPLNMLERVEVLAEGASATYGSDAVAGVVNFITRKRFDGIQISAQGSHKSKANGYNASFLAGKSWEGGSAIFAASRTDQQELFRRDRPFTDPNHIDEGGTNFNTFNCAPATLQPNGAGNIFINATSGTQVANTAANSPCSNFATTSLLPHETRNNVMIKTTQEFGSRVSLTAEVVYNQRRSSSATSRGTITSTAFQTGVQANPFYLTPVGYTGTATRQTVRYLADDLFGPGAKSLSGSNTYFADVQANVKLSDRFELSMLGLVSHDESFDRDDGVINGAVANLALNGTVQSNGSLTTPSLPGTNLIITQALTAANALDVWRGGSANLTSAATRAAILDNYNDLRQRHSVRQLRAIVDGTLMTLPGGDVGIAFGGELLHFSLDQFKVGANGAGRASSFSTSFSLKVPRSVKSAFAELNVPVVSEDMGIPLMQTFKINLSGRIDKYSDFGQTTNPKIAFSWDVVQGLRFRGNYSTSFVAPPLSIIGDENGVYVNSRYNSFTNNVEIPVRNYPQLAQLGIPGCTAASVTCNISSLQGLRVNTGDHNAGPQKGKGWAVGFDFSPTFLPGFKSQATLFNNEVRGGVTGAGIGFVANTPSLNYLLTFYPTGATQAQIDAATQFIPPASVLPTVTSYILMVINSNFVNVNIQGIDANASYEWGTDFGKFTVGNNLTYFTRFRQSFGKDGLEYSVLNSTGANGTFPSVQLQGRANVNWDYEKINAALFMNYVGSYHNLGGNSVAPLVRDVSGNPTGGGDKTKANVTFDFNLRYAFGEGGWLDKTDLTFNVRNIADKKPPFYNSANGYDSFVANPIGRMISLGFQKRF